MVCSAFSGVLRFFFGWQRGGLWCLFVAFKLRKRWLYSCTMVFSCFGFFFGRLVVYRVLVGCVFHGGEGWLFFCFGGLVFLCSCKDL